MKVKRTTSEGSIPSHSLRLVLSDSGEIIRDCSVSWPVGLAGGFQGSLTGRENATFVSKLIYGNKFSMIKKTIKFVEDFAEIGSYFDMPFKTYSSGMRLRVSFGLSMAFSYDVYLIDEITGVGKLPPISPLFAENSLGFSTSVFVQR